MSITCPRCDAHLSQNYATEPPLCLACGWEDYTYLVPKRERGSNTLMGGLASQLRYIGFSDLLEALTVAVRVERNEKAQAGIATVPTCPWDGRDMKVMSLGGKRKARSERTYRCSKRHRISLLSSANGAWRGWM